MGRGIGDVYQVVKKTIRKADEYHIWKYGMRTERSRTFIVTGWC